MLFLAEKLGEQWQNRGENRSRQRNERDQNNEDALGADVRDLNRLRNCCSLPHQIDLRPRCQAHARPASPVRGSSGVAVIPLKLCLTYPLEEYPDLRSYYAETVSEVTVECFFVRAPPHLDPALNAEHDEHLWCSPGGAVALLHWPETREAVLKIAAENGIHNDANKTEN